MFVLVVVLEARYRAYDSLSWKHLLYVFVYVMYIEVKIDTNFFYGCIDLLNDLEWNEMRLSNNN